MITSKRLPFLFKGISILFSIFFLGSCGGSAGSGAEGDSTNTDSIAPAPVTTPEPDCRVAGQVLEGNRLWSRKDNLLVVIKADSTTFDANLGASHRVLEIYDGPSCAMVDRHVLPVSGSPDYAYLLAQIIYNNTYELVGIRGYNAVYVYDLAGRKLLPRLEPRFLSRRYGTDAQSGQVQRLEVWEDYLIGYAQDYGSFAFDLREPDNPQPVLPFAEFRRPDDRWASLFLLPSGGNRFQALIPSYDRASGEYVINPLFPQPEALSTNIPTSARNNRYLVLRRTGPAASAIAIDLQEQRRIELPEDVATLKTQEILKWVRGRNGG